MLTAQELMMRADAISAAATPRSSVATPAEFSSTPITPPSALAIAAMSRSISRLVHLAFELERRAFPKTDQGI